MKTLRKLTAAALTMALLLSLLGGATAFAATVTTQGETAYVPLGQTGAVVYERHEAGYTVALSPAGDGVSVNLSTVPGDEAARAPEQARVYVRTGVTPKAGTAYEVSFALTAAAAQPEYAVRFDGGETPGAYGALEGRAIQAGETDRVRQTVRPQGESGELVVCLLLGKTGPEGNTLRLTDLTVAEAAPDGTAKTTVLVDKLDYRAPGFIRAWTNSDSAATLTSTEDSATLTVTKAPDPAEVWKTKLLVATGLKPQAGKTYLVSFDLKGSEVRPFEICYNEGDTEKGYDVLYSQTLTPAVQTIQRRIYIPRDKTNAGEIIVQLSLGQLKVGDSATVSNVRVEEEIPRYNNILPDDFNFEDHSVNAIYRHTTRVTSSKVIPVDINWSGGASVTATGGTLTTQDGAATLKIDSVGTEGYEAKLVVDTGMTLEAGKTYRVSFDLHSQEAYTAEGGGFALLYGTAAGWPNDRVYGEAFGQTIDAGATVKRTLSVTPAADGPLVISLELGRTQVGNEVTVSNFTIEELIPGQAGDEDLAQVKYPGDETSPDPGGEPVYDPGSFRMRDGKGGVITGDGKSATVTCTGAAGDEWTRGLLIKGICDGLTPGQYTVSLNIEADQDINYYRVCYNNGEDWPDGVESDGHYGTEIRRDEDGLKAGVAQTVTHTINVTAAGNKLVVRIDLGEAAEGTVVTVSGVQVERLDEETPGGDVGEPLGENMASVTYPTEGGSAPVTDPGSFSVRDSHGSISDGGENFATMTCEDVTNTWEKGMFIGGEGATLCTLEVGHSYKVSFGIQTDGQKITCNVSYNKDKPFGEGNEKGFGEQRDIKVSTEVVTVEQTITPTANGGLCLFLEFPDANTDTRVTISDIQVERLDGGTSGGGDQDVELSLTYPDGELGTFSARDKLGVVTGDGRSVTMRRPNEGVGESWQWALFTGTVCTFDEPGDYTVSFNIEANMDTTYDVFCNKNGDWGAGEGGFAKVYDQNTSSGAFSQEITAAVGDALSLRIDLGKAAENAEITISEIKVEKDGTSVDVVVEYPTLTTLGSFEARDMFGAVTGDENSATMTWPGQDALSTDDWRRALFLNEICEVTAGTEYEVSFDIASERDYKVSFFTTEDKYTDGFAEGTVAAGETSFTKTVTPASDGKLTLRINPVEKPDGDSVTISNLQVKALGAGGGSSSEDPFAGAAVTYPTTTGSAEPNPGCFEVRDASETYATLTGNGTSVTMTRGDVGADYQQGLFIGRDGEGICELTAGKQYQVSFKIKTSGADFKFKAVNSKDSKYGEGKENAYGSQDGLPATSTETEVTYTIDAAESGKLILFLQFDKAARGDQITVSDIQVREVLQGGSSGGAFAGADVTYPYPTTTSGGAGGHSFQVREDLGAIDGDGQSATVTWPAVDVGDQWKLGLFINGFCPMKAGVNYQVSFDVEGDQNYNVSFYTAGDKFNNDARFANGVIAASKGSFSQVVTPAEDGSLTLRVEPTQFNGSTLTIRNIKVVLAAEYTVGETTTIDRFNNSGVSIEVGEGYTGRLARHDDSVDFVVDRDGTTGPDTWRAKLCIDTGLTYQPGKDYRFKFDISSTEGCQNFCVITKGAVDPDDDMRGTWSQSVAAGGVTKTITTRPMTAGRGSGALGIDIELGNFNGKSNTYTVSNLVLEEVVTEVDTKLSWQRSSGGEGVNVDTQRGYTADLTRDKDSATLNVIETPTSGAEAWKMKLFINPDINVVKDQAVRVTFDVTAENDMDFEVCYNRNGIEKGFDAVYGLHLAAGQVKTVEKVFTAQGLGGKMIVQLSLGMVKAPNRITVQNLQVENINYTPSGVSALPAPADYHPSTGDVTYWAHADYAMDLLGSPSAVTAKINSAPQLGAEPWKIKLFVDTHTALQPGKFYRVTADLAAAKSQTIEICYNNGDVEMGYDSLTGIGLAAGQIQTVERVISVPADKTDLRNLMLQFNLGQTTAANEVTVSGVTVEEVTPAYAELIAPNFAYTPGGTVQLWTNTDCTADVACADGSVTTHVTAVPAGGAEVWKVQTRVRTGAILTPGKTYLVRADLLADKGQNFEVCYNNEETEKGYDALYGQTIAANTKTTVERKISVPATMTDAGELVLQFAIGGATPNNVTVSNISVQELSYGAAAAAIAPQAVVTLDQADGAGTLTVTREALTYQMTQVAPEAERNAIRLQGADLRANERYTVSFTARSPEGLSGALLLRSADGVTTALSGAFQATAEGAPVQFTTDQPLAEGGAYDLLWQFGGAENQARGGGTVELSNILLSVPAETLTVTRSTQKVTVNGRAVTPDAYAINGYNYFKLRDLATILNGTDAQFVVRYNAQSNAVSLTTGKPYTPVGGELTVGADLSAQCVRSGQSVAVDGQKVNLKVYSIGGYNYFRVRDLDRLLGYQVEYVPQTDTVAITSARTPEAQEQAHSYDLFFRPEIDGESQGYVGDTMPFYEDGTYYIYYLKEGGDAYNHSVYLTTTTDFVHYTELGEPVLSASREDVQDSWIGTGSVVKVEGSYYFFYTGFNSSGSQEYHEKIMVAKGSSPTAFTKVAGWEITPPDELGQKNDFRDPQAYYDPATGTISLTITASQGGRARVLKYTLDKDLKNATYDGIIYTDHTGAYWNLECSDTFRMGNKWYLTFSGQNDTVWYAMADSRFGPYTAPARLDGKIFYAAKHVEDGTNTYMVGWAHRSDPVTSTQSVDGWAGNLEVQQVKQNSDGTLTLVPVEAILGQFTAPAALSVPAETTVTASAQRVCQPAFLCGESFLLRGSFTYTGGGAFGLAFDFDGTEGGQKLISLEPKTGKLTLSFQGGNVPIAEIPAALQTGRTYAFTYVQDGSVGVFYLDGQAALTVRLYGTAGKPVSLFAQNNAVTFTGLELFTRWAPPQAGSTT